MAIININIMKIFEEIDRIQYLLTPEQTELVDLLRRLDFIIDENRVTFYQKDDFIIIELFSKEDKSCPFLFDFGIKKNINQFRFYLNQSAPIIEVELTNITLAQTIETVIELLRSDILEELTFVNNKLRLAKYKYSYLIYRERKLVPHITIKKMIWFWQRKQIKYNKYKPWII